MTAQANPGGSPMQQDPFESPELMEDSRPIRTMEYHRKMAWTPEEDNILRMHVAKYGPRKWSKMNPSIPSRIGKQCRERWHNHLDPNISKAHWLPHEDAILDSYHNTYGNQWSTIAKALPGRTDNAIKNRWNTRCKEAERNQTKQQENPGLPGLPHQTTYHPSYQAPPVQMPHDAPPGVYDAPYPYPAPTFVPCIANAPPQPDVFKWTVYLKEGQYPQMMPNYAMHPQQTHPQQTHPQHMHPHYAINLQYTDSQNRTPAAVPLCPNGGLQQHNNHASNVVRREPPAADPHCSSVVRPIPKRPRESSHDDRRPEKCMKTEKLDVLTDVLASWHSMISESKTASSGPQLTQLSSASRDECSQGFKPYSACSPSKATMASNDTQQTEQIDEVRKQASETEQTDEVRKQASETEQIVEVRKQASELQRELEQVKEAHRKTQEAAAEKADAVDKRVAQLEAELRQAEWNKTE